MPEDFLPFSRPSISEDDVAAVCEVLRSGWITTGAKAAEFERRFCETVGSPNAVALASATAGLHVALAALDIGAGDEVVTPSLTWASTPNLIVLSGAKPVFIDVDRDTLMIDAQRVEAALSERTRLIVPVHYAGAPAELEPLRALAERRGIALIEDAAHALGTEYRGERIGKRGTAIFSFHPIKNVTTGEGGMLTSDDPALAERVRRLKFHGLGVDAFDRETQGRAPQAEVLEPGYKYNLTDMSAALGLSQLARLDEFNAKRRALAERYLELFAEVEEIRPLAVPEDPASHAWHLFIVRVDSPRVTRDEFMAALKERGIGTGLHFRAVHLQRWYREQLGMRPGSLPDSEWNSDRICSLPLFPDMRLEDVERVVREIRAVLSVQSR